MNVPRVYKYGCYSHQRNCYPGPTTVEQKIGEELEYTDFY